MSVVKIALRASLVALAFAGSVPAVAATTINFVGAPNSVGIFGNLNPSGSGTDEYTFSFLTPGAVSGFVGTIGFRFVRTNLDFTQVLLNGSELQIDRGLGVETAAISIPGVAANQLQTLSVGYRNAQSLSSYGGVLTFEPSIAAVPEPATWAMLILGFGLTGTAMRYRRRRTTVSFA